MSRERVEPIIEILESSGLVSAEIVAELRETLSVDPAATDQTLVEQLTQHHLLTDYQADQLLAGRGPELKLAERYTIERPLGSGGMGEVYLADDSQLGRQVAIKVLPQGRVNDADSVARFHREAQALARMSHAAVVQAYDFGEDRGRVYLVMEYVEGESLRDRLLRKGPLPAGLAADYIYQAACGLIYAHHRGLVHRDLKPSNLLATEDRRIKILDLGLARFMQDQLADGTITLEGVGLGTPDFMAPEQFSDARRADARSDIYSLGCTLFNLLAGRVPYPGSSLVEKRRCHESAEVPTIGELREDVPAGLDIVMRRMMAKRPEDRFASVGMQDGRHRGCLEFARAFSHVDTRRRERRPEVMDIPGQFSRPVGTGGDVPDTASGERSWSGKNILCLRRRYVRGVSATQRRRVGNAHEKRRGGAASLRRGRTARGDGSVGLGPDVELNLGRTTIPLGRAKWTTSRISSSPTPAPIS